MLFVLIPLVTAAGGLFISFVDGIAPDTALVEAGGLLELELLHPVAASTATANAATVKYVQVFFITLFLFIPFLRLMAGAGCKLI
jgi:hypothetical protein